MKEKKFADITAKITSHLIEKCNINTNCTDKELADIITPKISELMRQGASEIAKAAQISTIDAMSYINNALIFQNK